MSEELIVDLVSDYKQIFADTQKITHAQIRFSHTVVAGEVYL